MSGPYNFNVAGDHGYDIPPFVSPFVSRHTTFILNPHAGIFVTSCIRTLENCAIAASFATILIISTFLIHEININSKQDDLSPRDVLKNLKIQNTNKIIIGHLNINSLRNKFECLKFIIDKSVEIFLISETKLNHTFPDSQFQSLDGFLPYVLTGKIEMTSQGDHLRVTIIFM